MSVRILFPCRLLAHSQPAHTRTHIRLRLVVVCTISARPPNMTGLPTMTFDEVDRCVPDHATVLRLHLGSGLGRALQRNPEALDRP